MLQETLDYLNERVGSFCPRCGLVLGSGLNFLADEQVVPEVAIPYEDIPGFCLSTADSHAGRLVFGRLAGMPVVCMQGRFHYYEGYSLTQVTHPVRVMARLGVEKLILTNAAGGIHPDFRPGDFMAITDHINFLGGNPLIGPNDAAFGPRYPDMSRIYEPSLIVDAQTVAETQGLRLVRGIYLATSGPSFETPAEIRAFRTLGADAVGMSTVPEAIVAAHMGVPVLGLSCISNLAAGLGGEVLSVEEVTQTAAQVRKPFAELILGLMKRWQEGLEE